MANLDTTRHLLRPSKRYVGARMQQGRSVLDSDWNEDATLRAEELRQTFVELIGAHGSSNAGFGIDEIDTFVQRLTADGSEVTTYDFGLRPGSFWLGGMRLTVDGEPETFLSQVDWLQINASASSLPTQPTAQELLGPPNMGGIHVYQPGLVAAQRLDLVYLEAWEQPVTAVEDSELRERALGGPDTSARIRRMRRIHVLPNLASSGFSAGLEQLRVLLENETTGTQTGTFDAETAELTSVARLTVVPIAEPGTQPCGPTPPRGYTGHEDQAIRVELRGTNSLVWGFGNAAPLYRARIGAGRLITLHGRPRDPHRYPQAGQIAELIPWGSKLPNDEKAAELTGHLVRISGSYNPATGELELAENLPEALVAWLTGATEHYRIQDPEPSYVYVRIWDRGPDITSDTLLDTRTGAVQLGHTGLQLTLEGAGRSGDYWIIAARRGTPELVVPWQLLTSEPPQGPRRFYAPLAIFTWEAPLQLLTAAQRDELEPGTFFSIPYDVESAVTAVYGPVVAKVTDVRRPLTRLCMRGCATISVGDGDISHGMVNSLADALDLLPLQGGRIQLLRGLHVVDELEALVLQSRRNITICGCGLESKLVSSELVTAAASIYTQGAPLLTLRDCDSIVLEDFIVVGDRAVGIKLENVGDTTNRNIRIVGVRFEMDGEHNPDETTPTYALSQASIVALGSDRLTVERCHVTYTDTLNYTPGMVLGGTNLRVRDNVIRAGDVEGPEDIEDPFLAQSMGGLHILSFSQNVEISGNEIRGGWGYGIGLGHLLEADALDLEPEEEIDAAVSWSRLSRMLGDVLSNLHEYAPHAEESPTEGEAANWTPGGPVIDVCIRDNRILGMGFSGISTGGFTDPGDPPHPRFIVAINIDIHRNEIARNVRITNLASSPFDIGLIGVGGVVLAASINAQIRENIIRDNGFNFATPTVGVGFVTAQGAVVQGNVIVDNGLAMDSADAPLDPGMRGGIVLLEVTPIRPGVHIPDSSPGVSVSRPAFNRRTNKIALTVRKNEVRHRTGKALWVVHGFGPIVVTENSLHGLGDPAVLTAIQRSKLAYGVVGDSLFEFPAQGACVEIRNYALSPAASYPEDVPTMFLGDLSTRPLPIVGGVIDFSRNDVSLNWHWLGGYAASVLLSSLDSVKVTDNVMRVVMGNSYYIPFESFSSGLGFLADVIANFELETRSFLMVNCWAGARSTVQASGNRFEEGLYDCLFSFIGAHAAAFADCEPDVTLTETANAALITMNVGTHCLIGPGIIPNDNVAIMPVVAECARYAAVDVDESIQTVYITPPTL